MIATLVRQAREAEIPVMIVSGDRDVYQLVDDGIRVMTTSRGVTDTKIYDREGVIERYGVAARAGHRTSSASRATPPTTSPASRGSATRPPPSCCSSSARWRRCWTTSTRSRARSASRT